MIEIKEIVKMKTNLTEYNSWRGMKDRCLNPKHKEYKYYGARGITVCQEWIDSSQAFLDDMGLKPSARHSIDRINFNGDYCKDNCRWATHETQQRNKRNSVYLSSEDIVNIRSIPRKLANGRGDGYTRKDISEMFDISVATTVRILNGSHHLCQK